MASEATKQLEDFPLDILAQHSRINTLYTQIALCYPLLDDSAQLREQIGKTVQDGISSLQNAFPWTGGHVVRDVNGVFKIEPSKGDAEYLSRSYLKDTSYAELQKNDFSMFDITEKIFCPVLTISSGPPLFTPVLLVALNFVVGGLILTINAQHGAIDMAGLGQVADLLTKACRGERFTDDELRVGNMNRQNLIRLLDKDQSAGVPKAQSTQSSSSVPFKTSATLRSPDCNWCSFKFSRAALSSLKSHATETIPANSSIGFISTDDALSALLWQSISRARAHRLSSLSSTESTLTRNVDTRRALNIPATYPGLVVHATSHTSTIDVLVHSSLGTLAADLRAALDPEELAYQTRVRATALSTKAEDNSTLSLKRDPSLDVRLTSWAKERCYELDFGFGKPEAVRRPWFTPREDLVYILPKALDESIVVSICLRDADMERLKADEQFCRYGVDIG